MLTSQSIMKMSNKSVYLKFMTVTVQLNGLNQALKRNDGDQNKRKGFLLGLVWADYCFISSQSFVV